MMNVIKYTLSLSCGIISTFYFLSCFRMILWDSPFLKFLVFALILALMAGIASVLLARKKAGAFILRVAIPALIIGAFLDVFYSVRERDPVNPINVAFATAEIRCESGDCVYRIPPNRDPLFSDVKLINSFELRNENSCVILSVAARSLGESSLVVDYQQYMAAVLLSKRLGGRGLLNYFYPSVVLFGSSLFPCSFE